MAGLLGKARAVERAGRGRDTVLAHIEPAEAAMLKRMGGRGTRNPKTGLPEFQFGDDNFGVSASYGGSYDSGGFDTGPSAPDGGDNWSSDPWTGEPVYGWYDPAALDDPNTDAQFQRELDAAIEAAKGGGIMGAIGRGAIGLLGFERDWVLAPDPVTSSPRPAVKTSWNPGALASFIAPGAGLLGSFLYDNFGPPKPTTGLEFTSSWPGVGPAATVTEGPNVGPVNVATGESRSLAAVTPTAERAPAGSPMVGPMATGDGAGSAGAAPQPQSAPLLMAAPAAAPAAQAPAGAAGLLSQADLAYIQGQPARPKPPQAFGASGSYVYNPQTGRVELVA